MVDGRLEDPPGYTLRRLVVEKRAVELVVKWQGTKTNRTGNRVIRSIIPFHEQRFLAISELLDGVKPTAPLVSAVHLAQWEKMIKQWCIDKDCVWS